MNPYSFCETLKAESREIIFGMSVRIYVDLIQLTANSDVAG